MANPEELRRRVEQVALLAMVTGVALLGMGLLMAGGAWIVRPLVDDLFRYSAPAPGAFGGPELFEATIAFSIHSGPVVALIGLSFAVFGARARPASELGRKGLLVAGAMAAALSLGLGVVWWIDAEALGLLVQGLGALAHVAQAAAIAGSLRWVSSPAVREACRARPSGGGTSA